jgi:hypothetical protein
VNRSVTVTRDPAEEQQAKETSCNKDKDNWTKDKVITIHNHNKRRSSDALVGNLSAPGLTIRKLHRSGSFASKGVVGSRSDPTSKRRRSTTETDPNRLTELSPIIHAVRLSLSARLISRETVFFSHSKTVTAGL